MRLHRSVLVIDDDVDQLQVLCALLQEHGYTVTGQPSARRALDYLREAHTPDVILLDLVMPDMDGWDFRVQQRRDPRLARIPVVALSAAGRLVDAEMLLRKPVPADELLRAIDAVASPG
jgi:CheY-like chemotaxis protein